MDRVTAKQILQAQPEATTAPVNPDLLEAEALDLEALAAQRRAQAIRTRVANAALVTASPSPVGHVKPSEYDRHARISAATRNRLVKAGMPIVPTSGTKYRIDVAEADAWRRANARNVVKRSRPEPDDSQINVSATLESAGLRLASGGRP